MVLNGIGRHTGRITSKTVYGFIKSVYYEEPSFQTPEDVTYLRKTLAVEVSEEKALEYFQNQFSEAYGGAWTTKLDWFFHSVKHR